MLYCPALERVSLASYPVARCNNGDPAVYYRPGLHQGPRRAMIYLKGGGVCFPNSQDFKVIISNHFYIYSISGLSCPEAEAYLTVIFHSFLHNNNINSDYILGEIMYFSPHGNFSSYF